MMIKKTINIYFDKQCPFCNYYANYVKLKQNHNLNLFNARESLDKIKLFREKGFDIDEGLIVEIDGLILQGSQALESLNDLSSSKIIYVDTKFFKYLVYPLLTKIRKLWFFIFNKNSHI